MQFLAENKCSCLFVHPGNFKELVKTATTGKKRLEDKRKKKDGICRNFRDKLISKHTGLTEVLIFLTVDEIL